MSLWLLHYSNIILLNNTQHVTVSDVRPTARYIKPSTGSAVSIDDFVLLFLVTAPLLDEIFMF